MPRNSQGVYTLPSGINPVSPQTIIATSWANPTLLDIADALTDSLSRSGLGGMTGSFKIADGTLALPGLAFTNEPGAGLWRSASSTVHMALAGVNWQTWGPAGVDVKGPFTIDGAAVVTGGPYLPLAGGTLTGLLVSSFNAAGIANSIRFDNAANAADTGNSLVWTHGGLGGNAGRIRGYRNGSSLDFALSFDLSPDLVNPVEVMTLYPQGAKFPKPVTIVAPTDTTTQILTLQGYRNFQPATYGAVALLAMSNATPNSHDFGAIRLEQNPGTSDGSGALMRFFTGGSSSTFPTAYEWLRATTQTSTGSKVVQIRIADKDRLIVDESATTIQTQGVTAYETGLVIKNPLNQSGTFMNIAFVGTAGQVAGIEGYQDDANGGSLQFKTKVAGVYAERMRISNQGWLSVGPTVASGVLTARSIAASGPAFCQLIVDYQGNSGAIYMDSAALYLRDNTQANIMLLNGGTIYAIKQFRWDSRVAQSTTNQVNSGTWDWSTTTTHILSNGTTLAIANPVVGEIKRVWWQNASVPAFTYPGGNFTWATGVTPTAGPGLVSLVCADAGLVVGTWTKVF